MTQPHSSIKIPYPLLLISLQYRYIKLHMMIVNDVKLHEQTDTHLMFNGNGMVMELHYMTLHYTTSPIKNKLEITTIPAFCLHNNTASQTIHTPNKSCKNINTKEQCKYNT